MNKKKKRGARKAPAIIGSIIAGIIIAGIVVYTNFFNGKYLYFTFGIPGDTLLRAGDASLTKGEAWILAADEKTGINEITGADALSSEIDNEKLSEYIKNSIKGKLTRICALNNMAKERYVSLSTVKKQKISEAASLYNNDLDKEIKQQTGVTSGDIDSLFYKIAIAEEMKNVLTDGMLVEVSTDDARVISLQFIKTDTEENIKEAARQLSEGIPFYEVAAKYNGDADYNVELRRGETAKEFEEAAYSLSTGQTGDAFRAGDSWYIIKCTGDNLSTKTEANRDALVAKKEHEMFEEIMIPYENKLYFEFDNDSWDRFDPVGLPDITIKIDEYYDKAVYDE